ncbi:MAG: Asp-tRNA(Asn)/Glu-tRNA(Gln) amidotransferase subunit GatC [Planctomycetota bacterium]|jgi:aspartyl-tRNA(Asn)/glutamyl-tRNA(Gln) amidotransferase subunit C
MAIDRKTVEHVAKLSRLDLAEAEIETFTSELARIVEYFDQLGELDVSKDEPMAHAAEGALLREDELGRSLPRTKALDGAPAARDGFFRVPPVIDDGAGS